MSESSQPTSENRKPDIQALVDSALRRSDPSAWFDILYKAAEGDSSQIPWAAMQPHPYLLDWLEREQISGGDRPAMVIGCGLGDDAEELSQRGFQVTAFDVSPKAIAWCQQRFPDAAVDYVTADLFDLPAEWQQRFHLVFECRTIQSLPLEVRERAIAATCSLVAPGGTLLVVTHLRDTEAPPLGPPWALSEGELGQFLTSGLRETQRDTFYGGNSGTVKILRLAYVADESVAGKATRT